MYWKGSIALSPSQDYPLLRRVLHSGFITHGQLFEFLKLDYCVSSRNAFNNRVLRLVKHGLLIRREPRPSTMKLSIWFRRPEPQNWRVAVNSFVHASGPGRSDRAHSSLHHSLELNEIHLALKRTGSLIYWTPETEIRSRNDLTSQGYWKYYDAVVVVRLAGHDCKFALEYERTPKAARHYFDIRQRIEQETRSLTFCTWCRTTTCCGLWQTGCRSANEPFTSAC